MVSNTAKTRELACAGFTEGIVGQARGSRRNTGDRASDERLSVRPPITAVFRREGRC